MRRRSRLQSAETSGEGDALTRMRDGVHKAGLGTKVDWDADDIRIMFSVAILLHLHLTVKTQNEWTLGRLLYC